MNLSFAEENYLKTIYHLSDGGKLDVNTNAISESIQTKAASVSDMLRRLSEKDLVHYEKYKGVNISDSGKKQALKVIRKHRLWEVFLVEQLKFNWDEVHEVAEQLEHIKSPLLIKRLDEYLGFPRFDPHGDPIPDENGEIIEKPQKAISETAVGESGLVMAVKDSNPLFLQHLDKMGIYLGAKIKVVEFNEFDGSLEIMLDQKHKMFLSEKVASNILISG